MYGEPAGNPDTMADNTLPESIAKTKCRSGSSLRESDKRYCPDGAWDKNCAIETAFDSLASSWGIRSGVDVLLSQADPSPTIKR
ncbi:MAG: hypothetical protein EBZ62_00975 [Sphingobacteriia bacterium]|nr:hypothetical protein [Sphingobacteriia bacterium]